MTKNFIFAIIGWSFCDASAYSFVENFQPGADSTVRAPIECFNSALKRGLSFHQATLLCNNAVSLEPVLCFKRSDEFLTSDQKVFLCQGATTQGPTDCFEEAETLMISPDQTIKLCNGAPFLKNRSSDGYRTGPVFCFHRSGRFQLTPDQRVILCADTDSDAPVHCLSQSEELGLTLDQRVRLCTKLGPSSW